MQGSSLGTSHQGVGASTLAGLRAENSDSETRAKTAQVHVCNFIARNIGLNDESKKQQLVNMMHTLRLALKSKYSQSNGIPPESGFAICINRDRLKEHFRKNIFPEDFRKSIFPEISVGEVDSFVDSLFTVFGGDRPITLTLFGEAFDDKFKTIIWALTGRDPDENVASDIRRQLEAGVISSPILLQTLTAACSDMSNATIALRTHAEGAVRCNGIDFPDMSLTRITFISPVMNSTFERSKLTSCRFKMGVEGVNFSNATIQTQTSFFGRVANSLFIECDITDTRFVTEMLKASDFSKAVIRGVSWQGVIDNVMFVNSRITGAHFIEITPPQNILSSFIRKVDPVPAKITGGTSFDGAYLTQVDFHCACIENATAVSASFLNVNARNARISEFDIKDLRVIGTTTAFSKGDLAEKRSLIRDLQLTRQTGVTQASDLDETSSSSLVPPVSTRAVRTASITNPRQIPLDSSSVGTHVAQFMRANFSSSDEQIIEEVNAFAKRHLKISQTNDDVSATNVNAAIVEFMKRKIESVSTLPKIMADSVDLILLGEDYVSMVSEGELEALTRHDFSQYSVRSEEYMFKLSGMAKGTMIMLAEMRKLSTDERYQLMLTQLIEYMKIVVDRVKFVSDKVKVCAKKYNSAKIDEATECKKIEARVSALETEIREMIDNYNAKIENSQMLPDEKSRVEAEIRDKQNLVRRHKANIIEYKRAVQGAAVNLELSMKEFKSTLLYLSKSTSLIAYSFVSSSDITDEVGGVFAQTCQRVNFFAILTKAQHRIAQIEEIYNDPYLTMEWKKEQILQLAYRQDFLLEDIESQVSELDMDAFAEQIRLLKSQFQRALPPMDASKAFLKLSEQHERLREAIDAAAVKLHIVMGELNPIPGVGVVLSKSKRLDPLGKDELIVQQTRAIESMQGIILDLLEAVSPHPPKESGVGFSPESSALEWHCKEIESYRTSDVGKTQHYVLAQVEEGSFKVCFAEDRNGPSASPEFPVVRLFHKECVEGGVKIRKVIKIQLEYVEVLYDVDQKDPARIIDPRMALKSIEIECSDASAKVGDDVKNQADILELLNSYAPSSMPKTELFFKFRIQNHARLLLFWHDKLGIHNSPTLPAAAR